MQTQKVPRIDYKNSIKQGCFNESQISFKMRKQLTPFILPTDCWLRDFMARPGFLNSAKDLNNSLPALMSDSSPYTVLGPFHSPSAPRVSSSGAVCERLPSPASQEQCHLFYRAVLENCFCGIYHSSLDISASLWCSQLRPGSLRAPIPASCPVRIFCAA